MGYCLCSCWQHAGRCTRMTSVGKPRRGRKEWSRCRWRPGRTLGWRLFQGPAGTGVYNDAQVAAVAEVVTQCRSEMELAF
eukprot:COSAG02_NODE_14567_length_1259_cov_1.345690_2_plen_80_part_00